MGCELSEARVADLIGQAKDGFAAWRKMADEENVARCRKIWCVPPPTAYHHHCP